MQVKKQQLELDMEKQTGSKLGKEYAKAVYCHPAYLTYMQITSCEILEWMNHKLQSLYAVILEPRKVKSDTVSTVSPSICHEVMGPDAMILVF